MGLNGDKIEVSDTKKAKASIPVVDRPQLSHRKFKQQDFRNSDFVDVNFKNSRFERCDFSYAVFNGAYFNGAKFEQCNFTGTRFIESNLNRASFQLCDFKFSRFERSLLDPTEILSNLPDGPNLRRELLQSLQANAVEIGAYRTQRYYALEELRATQEHNWKAVFGGDSYYDQKYPVLNKKLKPAASWIWLAIQDLIWGNGERPGRMIQSLAALLLFLSAINALPLFGRVGGIETWFGLRSLGYVITEFLAIDTNELYRGFAFIDYPVAVLRYVYIGLFVAVVFRASVHR